jgi:4-amino-4-deoxy-L-arabinose transferase-like glycosyltransferase
MNLNLNIRIQKKHGIFYILTLWILSLFFVNISGEFTLIDDWAYSKSVRDLSEFGVFKIYDRIAITFVSNLLWGSLFTKVFGFSFFVLRLSTVIAGGVLIYTFYRWLELLTENRKLQLFCTLLLAFNPLFYVLSTTL